MAELDRADHLDPLSILIVKRSIDRPTSFNGNSRFINQTFWVLVVPGNALGKLRHHRISNFVSWIGWLEQSSSDFGMRIKLVPRDGLQTF